ncbi:hypothetical protein CKM354_001131200 [Cercospora kikuchii]|uniref:Nephrocystin 3-like N-terminal domain-containing protein n=1 Tax=Cercospora kikuchii TaxID=84275 RepID=A0A9P3CSR3_9PEZI|nr:uncharacterized protein CKM354_001131200 [Cercospora kikuchii]GIZ48244.1 hypothetical protein CKM354_001131200 [Cercospora kikuchii]
MGRGDIDVKDLKLKQVYPSSKDALDDRKIDIVLIHGKAAHPYKTWTKQKPEEAIQTDSSSAHKKKYLDWTTEEDWLPSAIPGSRIFRFGYRGDWYGKDAIKTRTSDISTSLLDQIASTRRTCANRPLLFIAHSYGGLVLAKALADAWHDQTRWPDIYAATVGVVFLGTPFRGTTHLLHLAILPLIQSTDEFVFPDDIKASKADNDWLHDMFSDFCKSIRESVEDDGKAPSIACYFEREPTDLSFYLRNFQIAERETLASAHQYRDIVVSESSACLDNMSSTLDIRKFSRACDHLNLHRFTDLEDEEWKLFKQVLQEFSSVQPRLAKSYREKLIASLRYDNMGQRHASIPEPCEGTYSWIYTNPEDDSEDDSEDDKCEGHSFDTWLRNNEPTYWISGRAGSGKSVLLARIVDDEKTLEGLKSWSGQTYVQLLSFFFWKPGTGLENNVQGLLQSFLYQLCSSQPVVVTSEVVNELRLRNQQIPSWTVPRLTRVLQAILKATEPTRRYCIFIDGLDEFTGDQLDLLDFVLKLRHCGNVKCCVSSRPERPFEKALHSVPRLKLEDFNYHDISLYVQIAFGRADAASETRLINKICCRAEGVFLWAALVTRDVLRGLEAHDDFLVLVSRIEKLPLDLVELYRQMLEKVDQGHRASLAFYVQCLRAPSAIFSLFTSISILTADRLKNIPTSYKDFAAECEVTQILIRIHSGGLLEVSECDETQIKWATHLEKPESEWTMAADSGAEKPLKTRRVRAQSGHHVPLLRSEAQQVKWVHRSAYDFIFESNASNELDLPDLMEVSARLWRAALAYLWFAPSVYMPLHGRIPGFRRRRRLAIGTVHHCTSTVIRICQALGMAVLETTASQGRLHELSRVVAKFDIEEFGYMPLSDVYNHPFGELLYSISLVVGQPGTVMFWVLCANHSSSDLDFFARQMTPLTELQETSLAWFLLAHLTAWTEKIEPGDFDAASALQMWLYEIVTPMLYCIERLHQLGTPADVAKDTIITSRRKIFDAARFARRAMSAPGCDGDYVIGLKCRTPASGMICAAIGCVRRAWMQALFLHHHLFDEFKFCDIEVIDSHFRSCDTTFTFRYMSPHCPKLYLTPQLESQINEDVEQMSRPQAPQHILTIAQAVSRLDFKDISLSSLMKEHGYEEDAFWNITSIFAKRAAITTEYELRIMAEPARKRGKSLMEFWGAKSEALASYRAVRERCQYFINRAFDREIARETALGRFDSHPRTNAYDLDNDQL